MLLAKKKIINLALAPDELRWLSALARFAAALVIKGRFVPSAAGGRARWLPVIQNDDAEILEKFSAHIPNFDKTFTKDILTTLLDKIIRLSIGENSPKKGASPPTPHDGWMDGLVSDSASEIEIENEILNWQKNPLLRLESPVRVRVSLVEPRAGGGKANWGVRTLVRADKNGKFAPILDALESAQGIDKEFLFSALARVSRLSPAAADALKEKKKITSADALEKFISDEAKNLASSGIEFVKPWWLDEKTRDAARIKILVQATPTGTETDFTANADVAWHAVLNNSEISESKLQSLLKNPIEKIDGKFALLSRGEISHALEFLKNKKSECGAHEILRMSLDKNFDVQSSGWLGELLARLERQTSFEELPPPVNFDGTLRPYQNRGFSWLAFMMRYGLGACLADDMGLGKTVQTIAAVLAQKSLSSVPSLLVCPTSLIENWRRECERFAPSLRVLIHHGADRAKRGFNEKCSGYDIVITSYALAGRDEFLRNVGWGGVVLDESQNIKNSETAQSQAVRELHGKWRISLTGTPVENNIGDLWAQMDFLNPGILGTWGEFSRLYVKKFKKTRDEQILDDVKRLTGPFILRRLKTDKSIISDLPSKIETKQFCELTDEQIELYESAVDSLGDIDNSEGIKRKGMILSLLLRLKQICDHPALYKNSVGIPDSAVLGGRSGKLERLGEIAQEAGREKMLIFSQFAEMTEMIRKYIEETFGEECLVMHGGVARKERDILVRRFQSDKVDKNTRFFALTMKTGGTGLNLTAASQVVLFDRWWNPAVEQQATDRAFRIGQTKNVQVHSFICSKTLEDWIHSLIESKKMVAGRVISNGEEWLLNLSTQELRKVLKYGGSD